MTITEFIKARLDWEYERAYQAQGVLGAPSPWWKWPDLKTRAGMTRADAMHIEIHSPARVLREVEAKRALIANALEEKHAVVDDSWYTCPAAIDERDGGECGNDDMAGEPCTCGRDARVNRLLRQIAAPYADHGDYEQEWAP